MIIWDEYKYGEQVFIDGLVKTKKWQYKELKCLVKFMLKNESTPKVIRDKLKECCQDDIRYLKEKQRNNIFNKIIQQCKTELKSNKMIIDKKITIYQSEINELKKINNVDSEKVMFVLLVYSKWLDNMKWFSIIKNDLNKEAKINNINSINQQKILCDLFQAGYLKSEVKKVDNKHRKKEKDIKKQMWNIPILQTEGEIAFEFNNYTNFVFRYLNYVYSGYFECEKCKGMFKQNKKNNLVYCRECIQYQPIETKTIICQDCGKEVLIDGIVKKQIRCSECQKKKQLEWQRNSMKKNRNQKV